MEKLIYCNNEVKITIEEVDSVEGKVNVNGENLIWISLEEKENFIKELSGVLDKFRI